LVTEKEAGVLKKDVGSLEHLKTLVSVTVEHAQRISDKAIASEIVVEGTGEIL
jgi:hypothetical protein